MTAPRTELRPSDCKLEDLERFHDNPRRARASVTLQDEKSFNAYVDEFRDTEASRIFADPHEFKLVFIADYHTAEKAAFREHRATLTMPKAREWTTWRQSSGKRMAHVEFAQFIEENQIDIRVPAGAKILEVARGLSAKRTVAFGSAVIVPAVIVEAAQSPSSEGRCAATLSGEGVRK